MISTASTERRQAECVHLAERFGQRYRIGFDPAYDPKHRAKDSLDPWMMTIPCKMGIIHPHGGAMLAVEVDGHRVTRKRLAALDCCRVYVEGDDDGSYLFHAADFRAVAKLVKPHRKPTLTPEQQAAAAERLKAYQFSPGRAAMPAPNSTLERIGAGSDG